MHIIQNFNDGLTEDSLQIFVYGTLRKRGMANYFFKGYHVKEEGIWVSGFAMYDAGWYPFVVPVPAEENAWIVGDLYEVPTSIIAGLDEYEGPGYTKFYLEGLQALIYIKADRLFKDFPQVPGGDWLEYWKQKNG